MINVLSQWHLFCVFENLSKVPECTFLGAKKHVFALLYYRDLLLPYIHIYIYITYLENTTARIQTS